MGTCYLQPYETEFTYIPDPMLEHVLGIKVRQHAEQEIFLKSATSKVRELNMLNHAFESLFKNVEICPRDVPFYEDFRSSCTP